MTTNESKLEILTSADVIQSKYTLMAIQHVKDISEDNNLCDMQASADSNLREFLSKGSTDDISNILSFKPQMKYIQNIATNHCIDSISENDVPNIQKEYRTLITSKIRAIAFEMMATLQKSIALTAPDQPQSAISGICTSTSSFNNRKNEGRT